MSEEKNELEIIDKVEIIKEEAKKQLLERTIKSEEDLDKLIQTYTGDEIVISDQVRYDFFKKAEKEMKKIKNLIGKNRKDLTAPFVQFQKDMIALVEPWETKLTEAVNVISEKTKEFEDKQKAEAEKKYADRSKLLADNGYSVSGGNYISGIIVVTPDNIRDFTDEEFEFHLEQGKKEKARKEAEEERIKKEREEIERYRTELAKEREEIAKEREELAKLRGEIAKDKEVLDQSIDKIETKPDNSVKQEPEKPIDEPKPEETKADEAAAEAPLSDPVEKLKDDFKLEERETTDFEKEMFDKGFELAKNLILVQFTNLEIKKSRNEWIKFIKNLKQ